MIPSSLINVAPLDRITEILVDNECNRFSSVGFVQFMGGGQDCDFCNPYFIDVERLVESYELSCKADLEAIRQDNIRIKTEVYLHERVTEYLNSFSCLDNFKEVFGYEYTPKEYHYTLYYFDRAGNLVQTIPPKGVATDWMGNHTFKTYYYYNSLNQLVEQRSPDGGTTFFRYDSKGQLRLSQNEEQKEETPLEQFSYTKYDAQGRISEVGQIEGNFEEGQETSLEVLGDIVNLNNPNFPEEAEYVLNEITRTYYDLPVNPEGFIQENIRGRVSYVEFYEAEEINHSATYYNYDAHGNVKSLMQYIDALEPKRVDYDWAYRNLGRYLTGQGGVDVYAYDELKGNPDFEVAMKRVRYNIKGVLDEENSKNSIQIEGMNGSVGHVRRIFSDFTSAFGAVSIVTNGTLQTSYGDDGKLDGLSGKVYLTFFDKYDWGPAKRGGGVKAILGIGDHWQMNNLKVLGAKDFHVRGYFSASVSLDENGKLIFSNFKDSSSENQSKFPEPTREEFDIEGESVIYDGRQ